MTSTWDKNDLRTALLRYDKKAIKQMADDDTARRGFPAFVHDLLVPVLEEIGDAWTTGDAALSQIYLSGKVSEELFTEHLAEMPAHEVIDARIGILTLEDHHTLGKRIVSALVRSHGYNLLDMGSGICYLEAAERTLREGIDILLVSVLMYPSARKVENLKAELLKQGMKTRLLVGGAPFNMDESLWMSVGADAMGKTAYAGIGILNMWLKEEILL